MLSVVFKAILLAIVTLITLTRVAFSYYILRNQPRIVGIGRWYFRSLARVIGLEIHVNGQMSETRPLLVVSNHISYLDIIALGIAAPVIFTPKSEIARWPILGFFCKAVGCVFVDRRRNKTQENLDNMHQGLREGKPLLLFAEGTTSDGSDLLPIRSSYFQLSETFDEPLYIQPVLVHYEQVNHVPVDDVTRRKIAWIDDDELLPHLIELLKLGTISVSINFLDKIDVSDCKDRKDTASKCEEELRQAIANLH